MSNMFCLPKSAVFKSLVGFFSRTELKKLHNMSWQEEKRNFLAIPGDKKKKDCVKWQDLPTWKQYLKEAKDIAPQINPLAGQDIDHSKDDILADKITVFTGDITTLEVDAIVNAANKTLRGGGGVDGAIHRAAGKLLLAECESLGGCETGEAKITGGYKLPAKYVIHTVGPVGEKANLLRNCYANSLKLLMENNLRTIAFPCISTGIYGYPNESASHVASYTVRKHLEEHGDKIDRVIFCIFLDVDKKVYEGILQSYFPVGKQ